MFLRCSIFVLILLLSMHLEAKEHQKKFKESNNHKDLPKVNGSTIASSENVRLKKMHDNEIEKFIAGSVKFIRPRPSSSNNRVRGSSAPNANNRTYDSNRSPDTSIDKSIAKVNNLRAKYEKKKQPKLLNMRKNQQRNMKNAKNKLSPIRGCSSGIKGNKEGHACHTPGRKVKRCLTVPTVAEVIEQWNKTCIIPIPGWLWPGIWTFFG